MLNAFNQAADGLFGVPGSGVGGQAKLHIGTGELPFDLINRVRHEIASGRLSPREVLESLTAVRRQTAADPMRDTPKDNSLRAMRVILRETVFRAPVILQAALTNDEIDLLAACAASLHRAGHSRSRGRGRITLTIDGLPAGSLDRFVARVQGGA
ncbi:MAG: hypothetical protein IPK19_25085 [Chloroflexi bacterium]|nr:hypothetical protein [Chloroflexota bacterium]